MVHIQSVHTHFHTDVMSIAKMNAVLRINIFGADVNIFGSVDRLAKIGRAATGLNEAFGETELEALREAAE